jgi:two-component system invasion response regulator UvrY
VTRRPAPGVRRRAGARVARIAVLIADDHPVVRRGLRQTLADTADIDVAAEAGTAQEVLELVRRGRFDVAVLDLTMPGSHGLDLLETVHREVSALPVLILSHHPEDQYAVRALRAGAAGYLTKESAPDQLVEAIRKVHGGGRYVTTRVAEELALAVGLGTPAGHEALSQREFQVLTMLGRALSVKEIAAELHLSEKTVSTYRARILEKLRLHSTADLVRYAVQHRLSD